MTLIGAENKEPLSIRLRKSFRESIPPCSYSRILFVNWISYLHFQGRLVSSIERGYQSLNRILLLVFNSQRQASILTSRRHHRWNERSEVSICVAVQNVDWGRDLCGEVNSLVALGAEIAVESVSKSKNETPVFVYILLLYEKDLLKFSCSRMSEKGMYRFCCYMRSIY